MRADSEPRDGCKESLPAPWRRPVESRVGPGRDLRPAGGAIGP